MNEEITDVKPPMGFPHITDLAGSEATILQVANSQGDILGYATLNDIDAYIEQKVSETVHSFSQKQIFQDVTINGTFDGNNVVNQSKLNGALTNHIKVADYVVNTDGSYSGFTVGYVNLPFDRNRVISCLCRNYSDNTFCYAQLDNGSDDRLLIYSHSYGQILVRVFYI